MTHKIIHVVGTMGSGKTTLIKSFLREYEWQTIRDSKKVLGQFCPASPLFVVGRYEDALPSSGCDSFKHVEEVYEIIKDAWLDGLTVIYEGLFMMNHTRGPQLQKETRSVTVLKLTTALDVCLAGVMARRKAQGTADDSRPKHLEANDVRARNYAFKMARAGAEVIKITRESGLKELTQLVED